MKTYTQLLKEFTSSTNKDFDKNKENFDVNNIEFQKGDDSTWFLKSDSFDITVKRVLDSQEKPFPDHYVINIQKLSDESVLSFLDVWGMKYTKNDDVYTIIVINIDEVNIVLTELKLMPIKE